MNSIFDSKIDLISQVFDLNIRMHNGYFIVNNLRFSSFKRLVLYIGKSFEMEDYLLPNRPLSSLANIYREEPDVEFLNFEWTSSKHLHLVESNGYFDGDENFIATRNFTIAMPWGIAHIKRTNRLRMLYNMEGMEAGFMIINSRKDPTIFASDKENLRLINHDMSHPAVKIFKSLSSERMNSKLRNIASMGMLETVLEWCKSGLVTTISLSPSHELRFALVLIGDPDALALPNLRINTMEPIRLIEKVLYKMAPSDTTLATKAVVRVCRDTNMHIPRSIASVLATRSKLESAASSETKKFIFGLIETFFYVSDASPTIVSEQYGNTKYSYHGSGDSSTARKIAKKLLAIEVVSDSLENISITEIISLVHEYLDADHVIASQKNENISFRFDNVRMFFMFGKRALKFDRINLKTVSKATKWIIADRGSYENSTMRNRAQTYKFIFKSTEDANRALRMTFGLALAILFDLPYKIKVFSSYNIGKKNIYRYFNAPAFNPISSVGKNPDMLSLKGNDFGILDEGRSEYYPKIKQQIVFVEDIGDADIVMNDVDFNRKMYTQSLRLATVPPDKKYVRCFRNTLTLLSSRYADRNQMITHLGENDNLEKIVNNVEIILVQ